MPPTMPARKNGPSPVAKPFLRWAGGKRWLLPRLSELLPSDGFGTYHEPFLGGGAVFFDLSLEGTASLSDVNRELIDTYKSVRDDVEAVISCLGSYSNTEECYYATREVVPHDPTERAARFIYLNQTSFNGIYRVNRQGQYNVPYGHRTKPFLDAPNLRRASSRLAGIRIGCADFATVEENARPGDFVFLDPPYTVSHRNNGFVRYNQKLFSLADQERLSELIASLNASGVRYVLTNAAHATISELFSRDNRRIEISRVSRVGGKGAARGRFSEYIFTNVERP